MRIFLRAKHWQVFLVLFALPTVAQFATMSATNPPYWFVAVMILCVVGSVSWFWSMGAFFSSILPSTMRVSLGFFHFALVYPVIYVPFFLWFALGATPISVLAILPLHLFAMFCMFYDLYFVSRIFVMAETGRKASFSDYIGPLMLLWFYPVGIWIIQPRVNRLYLSRAS